MYLDGHTNLMYKRPKNKNSSFTFELNFKTKRKYGLILYMNFDKQNDSYIIFGILKKKLTILVKSLTSKKYDIMKSDIGLNDNKWHSIRLERKRQNIYLTIDDKYKFHTVINGIKSFVFDKKLHLGGNRMLPSNLPFGFYYGFNGCLMDLKLNGKNINIVYDTLTPQYKPVYCKN